MRVVAWIRVIAFALATLGMAALAVFARLLGVASERTAARWAARCSRIWCRAGCFLLGVPIRVDGPVPRGAFLAASNHLSYLDILVLGAMWPGVFVAKREIASWPLFGLAARAAGTVFIDRESPRELVRVGRRMSAALGHGLAVTLFPEGRITDGTAVLPFQPPLLAPAARDRVPCYAVTLNYELEEPDVDPTTEVCWPTDRPLLPHVLRVVSMPTLRVTVHIAPEPTIEGDRKRLARTLHARVEARHRPFRRPQADSTCAP